MKQDLTRPLPVGLKLRCQPNGATEFEAEVIGCEGNDLRVRITSKVSGVWDETWNLAHTHVGLSQGIYSIVPSRSEQFQQQSLQQRYTRLQEISEELTDWPILFLARIQAPLPLPYTRLT